MPIQHTQSRARRGRQPAATDEISLAAMTTSMVTGSSARRDAAALGEGAHAGFKMKFAVESDSLTRMCALGEALKTSTTLTTLTLGALVSGVRRPWARRSRPTPRSRHSPWGNDPRDAVAGPIAGAPPTPRSQHHLRAMLGAASVAALARRSRPTPRLQHSTFGTMVSGERAARSWARRPRPTPRSSLALGQWLEPRRRGLGRGLKTNATLTTLDLSNISATRAPRP